MRQPAFLIGLAGGGLVVPVMSLVYRANPTVFLSPVFQWSLGIIYLAAMLVAGAGRPAYERSTATRRAFVAFALVSASYYLYYFLLLAVFDPSLVELQSELMIENARAFGLAKPGAAVDQPEVLYAVERLRPSVGGTFYSFVQGLLFGGALSFLIGYALGRPKSVQPLEEGV